jgi:hypothetical protein
MKALVAISSKADCIVTRDLKDFSSSPIAVKDPSDFLEGIR